MGLGLTCPDDHYFVVTVLAGKSVSLFQRQRGLFTGADGGMSGPELADFLPVCDAGGRFTADVLPVHIGSRAL